MRQTPGGSGDTAPRTPSWRAEVEGGSQDGRATPSLIPAPVSSLLGVALGDTLGTPSTGGVGGDPRQRAAEGVMGMGDGDG